MTVHESGDKGKPVIMLFPGTMCYWKGNFGGVIYELKKTFLVAAVAYTGFDEEDTESYASVEYELEKIEQYISTTTAAGSAPPTAALWAERSWHTSRQGTESTFNTVS